MRDSKDYVANYTADVTCYRPINNFARKARRLIHKSKVKLVFFVVIIICGFASKAFPLRAKVILIVTLLLIVCPFEVIPNVTPYVGFTDDIFVRMTAMNALRKFFTIENSIKARRWLLKRQRQKLSLYGVLISKQIRDNVNGSRTKEPIKPTIQVIYCRKDCSFAASKTNEYEKNHLSERTPRKM